MRLLIRSYGDSAMSFTALAAILAWIILSDVRLSDQMHRRVQGMSFDLADAGTHVEKVASNLVATMQVHSYEYAHLWTFLIVAVVLTVWMLRS